MAVKRELEAANVLSNLPIEWLSETVFSLKTQKYLATRRISGPAVVSHDVPGYSLATIIHTESLVVRKSWMQKLVADYSQNDDVFRVEFLANIVFIGVRPSDIVLERGAQDLLKGWGSWYTTASLDQFSAPPPPTGPYLARGKSCWQVRRLYDDFNQTFLTACVPAEDGTSGYRRIGLTGDDYGTLSVAVPSRLYHQKSSECPLAGVRISVKDILDLEGLKTSAGSRSYFDVSAPCDKTAKSIQHLIDAGAEIVGKNKLSSFAAREEPTECVDYPAPFNPRADGYQSPAGSSSGSAAAVASYDWLDFAIGTDTTGSGRRPAHFNGCFSLRPTHKALSLAGLVLTFEMFDTPCFFGRDIKNFREFANIWYGTNLKHSHVENPGHHRVTRIIYPLDFISHLNPVQKHLIDGFVKDLESLLGIRKTEISFDEKWTTSAPEGLAKQSLQQFMEHAPTHAFFYDLYHNFDDFRAKYLAKFKKAPYVSPMLRWRWEIARGLTRSQRDDAVQRLQTFRHWFLDEVMCVSTHRTIVILPIESMRSNYRDDPPPPPKMPHGIGMLDLSPTLGAPELVVPIGEMNYKSRVSKRDERLPVGLSLMGAPGTDLELIEAAQACLETSERPTCVLTGSSLFTKTTDAKLEDEIGIWDS